MNIQTLEHLMYQLSDLFLAPVLILLVLLFSYSLYATGSFSYQAFQRRYFKQAYNKALNNFPSTTGIERFSGYPLTEMVIASLSNKTDKSMHNAQPLHKDHLDVAALKELEMVRAVSRLAPMLGLIATMVPMGPALKSLADGNVQGISENLIVAFSAVIFGLVIASITFWISTVKKRWLATELVNLHPYINPQRENTLNNNTLNNDNPRNVINSVLDQVIDDVPNGAITTAKEGKHEIA